MNGLIKAFIGQDNFSGKNEEDLESVLNVSETLEEMFCVTADDMRKSMPIMLKGNDINILSKRSKDCRTYQEGSRQLKSWLNSKAKQTAC